MIGAISNNSLLPQTQLNKNVSFQNGVLKRLATGRRINSGKDDPAGLIAASQLESALAALEGESRSIQRVHSNANIADGHTAQLASMTSELRGLVVASANTAGMSDAEIAANQMQIDNLSASIHRFSHDAIASLDGISLPDGGNEQLAQDLHDAAIAVSTLASGGANDLRSGNFEAMQTAVADATTAFAEARGTIGAYQKYNLETRQNSLAIERENLMASHSRIVDADYAEEASKLAQSKVLVAAGIEVLKIANSNPQNVLKLLS